MAKLSQMALPDVTGNAGRVKKGQTAGTVNCRSIGSDSPIQSLERENAKMSEMGTKCRFPIVGRMMGSSGTTPPVPLRRALGSSSLSKCQHRGVLAIHAGGPRAPRMDGNMLPDGATGCDGQCWQGQGGSAGTANCRSIGSGSPCQSLESERAKMRVECQCPR